MLSKGSGLFPVDESKRNAEQTAALKSHRWRARLLAHLRRAREHGADWVYFRLECDAGGPKPEIFLYDRTTAGLAGGGAASETAQLHHELWNYGRVPLAFFLRPTSVEIINLLQPPTLGDQGQPLPPEPLDRLPSPAEILATAGAAASGITAWNRYQARYFDNGTFWEMPANQELGRPGESSMASMVEEMRQVRDALEKTFIRRKWLPAPEEARAFVRRMLIITLMVRFMEERGILPRDYFAAQEHLDATDFKSLLRHRTPLLRALKRLAEDFNGDVFTLEEEVPAGEVAIQKILGSVPQEALNLIADFAEGRMKGGQRWFWERYSFRHLPVEAISYVYEDFLDGKNQAYFTPHHLVDLLLDESMTPERVRSAFQQRDPRDAKAPPAFPILDPACGSGVFLVGGWRRLVEALLLLDESPTPATLKRLLEQNIYGVDLARDSVELTIFSLCVAFSSALRPPPDDPHFVFRTLQSLKFPNLKPNAAKQREGNVIEGDFFAVRPRLMQAPLRFQLIAGNPPFESKLRGAEQTTLDAKADDEDGKNWPPVPDDNVSYLFLRSVSPLLADGGVACLVQPAGLLYNEKAADFRRALFSHWHVAEVLDFASLSGLFTTRKKSTRTNSDGKAKVLVKTVAVLIERRPAESKVPLLHATFRRTIALGQREVFEIDPQDLHWIPRDLAVNEPRVWKANLLGGGRLLETYASLTAGETIKKFVARNGWLFLEGFTVGASPKHHHPEAKGMPFIDTAKFQDGGLDENDIRPLELEHFHRPLNPRLFEPPHLLINEHETLPTVLREAGSPLYFRHEIAGIKAHKEDLVRLRELASGIRSFAHYFPFFAAFGPRYLTGRQTAVLKKDIEDLPCPTSDKLVFRGVQKHLRDDVIEFMIPLVKDNKKGRADLAREAGASDVKAYAQVFLEVMQTAYADLRFVATHDLGGAWCVSFHKGTGQAQAFGDSTALVKHLDSLIRHDQGRALRCWRIVRHFSGQDLYILKPKPRRYWLKSAAVRDADEMFAWAMRHTLDKANRPKLARD